MSADTDRPPERWSLLDAVGWFCELAGRALKGLHRFCHRWEPKCPDCAANLKKADEWADRFLALERDLAREQAKREVAPGTPVLGGREEGGISYIGLLYREHSAVHDPVPIWNTTAPAGSPPEPPGPLTYAEVVAMQGPKPLGLIPDAMREAARILAAPPADSWGRVNLLVPDLVLTKGEARMGCTVREADAAAQIIGAMAFEDGAAPQTPVEVGERA